MKVSHFVPSPFVDRSFPGNAGNAGGPNPPFAPQAAGGQSPAPGAADPATGATPSEPAEAPAGASQSVAHRARAYLSTYGGLAGLQSADGPELKNFGALVSLIARGLFVEPAAPAAEGDAAQAAAEAGEAAPAADEPAETTAAAADESDETAAETASADGAEDVLPPEPAGDTVAGLVDTLLDDDADDGAAVS